ncbi:coumaroyl-CoA:anthocyanidin 3-O-glucoside-6''-O-coumaroyltransferase 1-like [Ananas comosus]|uniref:Coumaroyl-CoA:anthocyanidin 3-O-glucoside-6''-O-coumaroyltransferase 1-like n=1 Tax=Ananas comosus TaxID=4615 RepID=A0A6P5EDY9_ANACO|nr:coumaroyl-CoA:anthocyanidin 3-O-glucoside-6''-O-coumaroyltransferase 1-like [Ananas comosus]
MAIRVLDRIPVSPPPGSVPATTLPLTFFDASWLFTGPVERLFFFSYPHPTPHFLSHHLPPLLSSLSLSLRSFFPLAGRVDRPLSSDPPALSFSPSSHSLTLTLAESSADFDLLSGDSPRHFAELYSLVPQLPPSSGDDDGDGDGSIPLAAVQVTVFPSRGICVGLSVHHVACDDSSSMHFVRSWAAACRLGGAEPPATAPPFYDRGVIADPNGLCSKTLAEMRQLAANGPPPPPPEKPPLLIASFSLGRDWIEQLKQRVTAKAAENGLAIHSSTFVAACAFAWICLIKSQRGFADKKSAHLLFSVECRSRLNPPIPEEYFGNCLRPCFVEAKMADLVEKDGVLAAAMAIGRAIKGLENGVLEGAEGWMQKILSILPEGPMSVAGSPRFQVYGTDFGWGRPKKVDLPSIEKTPGTVSLAESSDEQGGVEIGLVLPKDEMDAFQSCFYDELKLF